MQNLHTHCTFCDGKDTPEQMIEAAIEKGFTSIGFSSHSYAFFSELREYSITAEKEPLYFSEIRALQKKYEGKIDIFLGLEFEMYSQCSLLGYDYLIGSVHYLKKGDTYLGFDRDAATVKAIIDNHYDGDGMKYAEAYYEAMCELPKHGRFDIIGHYDLITKHAETHDFFDMHSKKYREYAITALETLKGKIPFFEVNTGAIGRGYRTTPYPEKSLLCEFRRLGFGAVITSDCHDRTFLDCYRKESEELLRAAGFRELYILTKDGFQPEKL